MSRGVAAVIGLILAVAATVLAMIFITPEKRRKGQNKVFRLLADIFNFRSLLLEYIFRALYIFSTLFCVSYGVFLLLSWDSYYYGYYGKDIDYHGGEGLVWIIGGVIATRIVFEFVMMAILLVKNVIQINNKLENNGDGKTSDPFASAIDFSNFKSEANSNNAPANNAPRNETPSYAQPANNYAPQNNVPNYGVQNNVPNYAQPNAAPRTVYCNKCGTPYDPSKGGCPYGCAQ